MTKGPSPTRPSSLVAEYFDVLEARPAGGEAPPTLLARGWADYLLALDDAALEQIESQGLAASLRDAPASLRALLDAARADCVVPPLARPAPSKRPRKLETPRKRAQIDAFAALILPIARARVLDVGSGHGHLTREIAARLAVPVVGLERDARLAARARSLGGDFDEVDVVKRGLALSPDDCVVGLHACGELGDAMVESAARVGASVALIGCCLQKRRGPRRSFTEDLELSARVLGLSNLTARDVGVEATRAENLAARERRLALHFLLTRRVGALRHGAEIDGLNRRVAQHDLRTLVTRAFDHRALAHPAPSEVDEAARWAATQFARARRLSVPRALLARPLELYVLRDRAAYLEARGYRVELGEAFPAEVSARNLALIATPELTEGR